MTAQTMSTGNSVLRQEVLGARRFSNYWWATIVSMGGIGFLLAGLSSYFKINLLLVGDTRPLAFFPQGFAMTFYGVAGSLLALYLWLSIFWNLGGGHNEFNQETGHIQIFRWGYPGKNRHVEFTCTLEDVQSIRIEVKDGLNPKRALYLKLKDRRQVPLTRVGQPIGLSELENQGAELARFLKVPLEGL